jgi:hypothetical protein
MPPKGDKMSRQAGFHHSLKTKNKIRLANLGVGAHNWKGNEAKYRSIHAWVQRNKQKPNKCENCGLNSKLEWAYEDHFARRNGKSYKRDLNLFHALCRKCHINFDKRIDIIKISNIGRPMSNEHKEKLRSVNLGKKLTPEHKEKLRLFHLGRKASSETLEKLRISHLGQKPWNKGKTTKKGDQ